MKWSLERERASRPEWRWAVGQHEGKSRVWGHERAAARCRWTRQTGDLPGKKLDQEGNKGRRGLKDREKLQGQRCVLSDSTQFVLEYQSE